MCCAFLPSGVPPSYIFSNRFRFLSLSLLVTIFSLLVADQARADQDPMSLLGRWPTGPCEAAALCPDLLAIQNGGAVDFIDRADPEAPQRLSRLALPSTPWQLAFSGDLLVAACSYSGVQIIACGDPTNPQIVDEFAEFTPVTAIAAQGSYAFGVSLYGGFFILDLREPAQTQLVGQWEAPSIWYMFWDVAVDGDLAFLAASDHGLLIIDISDPSQPVPVGELPWSGPV